MAQDATRRGRAPFPRWVRAGLGGLAFLGVVALLGPRHRFDPTWVEPELAPRIDAYLEAAERAVPDLRDGDEKSIVWRDPDAPAATAVSIVYLHGFSADRHEVEPLVTRLAAELDANVYFTRLRGHGRDAAAMGEATAEAWLADAAEAVAIGSRIGDRVLLMGTSTGGTLALWAAARPESAGRVDALVLISPNLRLRDPAARILTWPWGGLIARWVVGAERCFEPLNPAQALHWTTCHPTRALLPMAALAAHVRTLDPADSGVSAWVAYAPGDLVVDPEETLRFMADFGGGGTELYAVEGADDPEQHVLAGDIMSPSTTFDLLERILAFWRSLEVG